MQGICNVSRVHVKLRLRRQFAPAVALRAGPTRGGAHYVLSQKRALLPAAAISRKVTLFEML